MAKLGHWFERQMHKSLSPYGLSSGQFIALSRVASRSGVSRADLARDLQVSPQAAGVLTSQLIEKGLLARTTSRRGFATAYFLTAEGLATVREATIEMDILGRRVLLQCFSPRGVRQVDAAMRHVLTKIGEGRAV